MGKRNLAGLGRAAAATANREHPDRHDPRSHQEPRSTKLSSNLVFPVASVGSEECLDVPLTTNAVSIAVPTSRSPSKKKAESTRNELDS